MENAVYSMRRGTDKKELIKLVHTKRGLQKAYDIAEASFKSADRSDLDETPVLHKYAHLLTKYEILKGIADRLMAVEILIIEKVGQNYDPALKGCLDMVVLDVDMYRYKWNQLNALHVWEIKAFMALNSSNITYNQGIGRNL